MALTRKHFNRAADICNAHDVARDRRVLRRAFYEFFRSFEGNFDGGRFMEAIPLDTKPASTVEWVEDLLGGKDTVSLAMDDGEDRRRMAEWIVSEVLS